MKKIFLFGLFLFGANAQSTTYYMSITGNDGANGLTVGTAWASPNHALTCADTIIAQPSTSYPDGFTFGAVTCPGTHGVARLTCATSFACQVNVTSGNQFFSAMQVGASNWMVDGWQNSTISITGHCFFAFPASSSTNIHDIIFANDICNGAGQTGFSSSTNGSAGVDYFAVIGSIAYATSAGSSFCDSGIDVFQPVAWDSAPGTHIYFGGNFAWDNVNPATCAGISATDGEGLFFDTVQPYAQQLVMDNNISIYNGGNGLKAYNNSTGTPNAKIYFRHNTSYGNETGSVNGGICSEISLQASLSSEVFLNLGQTGASTGCNGPSSIFVLASSSDNSTDVFWNNYGYSAAAHNTSTTSALLVNNTFSNPSFANPTNPGAPSCGAFASVPACMATVIANFKPTLAAAIPYGYQQPSTTSVYDPLYPQWLCTVTNLPTGLVTPGCLAADAAGAGVKLNSGTTLK